ncbi:MAG TPA: hypothetical protein VJT72_23350 [Pseudonocardiaceae bacterium]|nr:hypothetical protein [Pseudonocardiaceae bacterium]
MAQLIPLPQRKRYLTGEELTAAQADPGLYDALREMLPDTTGDVEDPWDRMPLNDSWIAVTAMPEPFPQIFGYQSDHMAPLQ